MDELTDLPEELQSIIARVLDEQGFDVHSASEMRGECEDYSDALSAAIGDLETVLDEDGDVDPEELREATTIQMPDPPAAIADNDMAHGHYVCRVEWGYETYYVDLTIAQFPALGATGPGYHMAHCW